MQRDGHGAPLENRFPEHFFDGGQSVTELSYAAAAKGNHPVFDGFLSQLKRGSAAEDHLPERVAYLHHLVEPEASFVACVVAGRATFALEQLDARGFLR